MDSAQHSRVVSSAPTLVAMLGGRLGGSSTGWTSSSLANGRTWYIVNGAMLWMALLHAPDIGNSIQTSAAGACNERGQQTQLPRRSPMAMAVLPVPGWPASSTPRPAILPSLIMAVMTPAACAGGHGSRAAWVQGRRRQSEAGRRRGSGGGGMCSNVQRPSSRGSVPRLPAICHASGYQQHALPGCSSTSKRPRSAPPSCAGGGQRAAAAAATGLAAGLGPSPPRHRAAGTHLARGGLAHEALRHCTGLQGVIEAQAADVGVGADPLDAGEVLDLGRDPQVGHCVPRGPPRPPRAAKCRSAVCLD